MKWFGKSWGALICSEARRTKTPIDTNCCQCDKGILESDQGFLLPFAYVGNPPEEMRNMIVDEDGQVHVVYHLDCLLKNIGVK